MSITKNLKTTVRGTRKIYFEKFRKIKDITEAQALREIIDYFIKNNPL